MRVVFLTGMMGSGKTQAGRTLAERLGWAFLDTDAEIISREGRPILEIFRDRGEAHFRDVERTVMREAARRRATVISTGGGAVLSSMTRRLMRRAGPVIYLRAPLKVLLERLGDDPGRPLLGDDPVAALTRLYAQRGPLYEEGSIPVDASRSVNEVVEHIVGALAAAIRQTIRVHLGARSYDVQVGAGILPLSPPASAAWPGRSCTKRLDLAVSR